MSEKINYAEMVATLLKPGSEIKSSMSSYRASLTHLALGVAGEAGEIVDAIKKHVIYNKALDRANIVEELGDMEFFMEGIRSELGITREECIAENIRKLSVRYNGLKYSDKAAQDREDKQADV